MRQIVTWLRLVGLLFPVVSAAGDIILRAAVEPTEAWVGQRVVLQVDVLGTEALATAGAELAVLSAQGDPARSTLAHVSQTDPALAFGTGNTAVLASCLTALQA